MLKYSKLIHNLPIDLPMNFSGKLSTKIIQKKDFVRADGTQALYIQIIIRKAIKRIPLLISVKASEFDLVKQRVNKKCSLAGDYNLIIEKALAQVNRIEVGYRLSNQVLTLDRFVEEYTNPSSRLCFIKFWEKEMVRQQELLNPSTYRQQMTMLNKLREYRSQVLFYEIDAEFIKGIMAYFKKKKNNNDNTIASFIKSFKKYVHIAEKRGICLPIEHEDIKNKSFSSSRTFLDPDEIRKIYNFYSSEFINETQKAIINRFLFSCFTGLRLSDSLKITKDNFIGDFLVFTTVKTNKFQRIPLSFSAKKFINKQLFQEAFSPEYMNRELKVISRLCGISKKVSFHVARHTFATNFLLSGGRVEVLQKLLGHSKINETMIYVHIVDSITDIQILNMDEILKLTPLN